MCTRKCTQRRARSPKVIETGTPTSSPRDTFGHLDHGTHTHIRLSARIFESGRLLPWQPVYKARVSCCGNCREEKVKTFDDWVTEWQNWLLSRLGRRLQKAELRHDKIRKHRKRENQCVPYGIRWTSKSRLTSNSVFSAYFLAKLSVVIKFDRHI